MKGIAKYVTAVFALALFAALACGCASNAASSGAASAPEQLTPEELIAELQELSDQNDYQSVTMDMQGNMSMDLSAMFSVEDADENSDEASASSEAADAAAADEGEGASDESSDDSSLDIPISIKALSDISSGKVKMYLTMNMLGQDIELYIDGDKAVMVVMGQAVEGTLEDFNMQSYSSIESIMQTQGANLDGIKDAIDTIEKTTEGSETVYTLSVDPSKVQSTAEEGQTSTMAQYSSMVSKIGIVYRFDASNKLTGLDIDMDGTGFTSSIKTTLSDYDATTVPDAPTDTVSYSDYAQSMGLGDDASAQELVEEAEEAASSAAAAA